MTDFVTAGPLAWTVDDARIMVAVLAERELPRHAPRRLRIGYCARPEGRAVDPVVTANLAMVATMLSDLGHDVVECDLPVHGWQEVFGPLVLDDELRERQHLLDQPELLTRYGLATLCAARDLDSAEVDRARRSLEGFRARTDHFLREYDAVLTPTVATPAFPHHLRPTSIDGVGVDWLWGAFPFTAPLNVAGVPAITLPTGLAHGLPIGAQLVTAAGRDADLLNLAESVEAAIGFDYRPVRERWADPTPVEQVHAEPVS